MGGEERVELWGARLLLPHIPWAPKHVPHCGALPVLLGPPPFSKQRHQVLAGRGPLLEPAEAAPVAGSPGSWQDPVLRGDAL